MSVVRTAIGYWSKTVSTTAGDSEVQTPKLRGAGSFFPLFDGLGQDEGRGLHDDWRAENRWCCYHVGESEWAVMHWRFVYGPSHRYHRRG